MTATPIPEDILVTAVGTFRGSAAASFDKASKALSDLTAAEPGTADARKRAEWEAAVAKAKAEMTSSLQQLAQADIMLSELKGRASYRALADLVVDTNTSLKNLLNVTSGSSSDLQALAELINAHAALLEALANIAPLATWTGARSSGAG